MNFLSLFSGIGGLDLGLERAGMTCVGQVEIDPYCRAVLAKHWPGVPRHDDVRTWAWDGTAIDLVCGGVPCQPASCAGKRKGAADERWLWGEFLRVVSSVRPAWVLAENVRGFLSLKDSARVFNGLEALHYEIGTLVLGAHHVGAPHKRDRVWIVGRLAHAGVSRANPHAAPVRTRDGAAGKPVRGPSNMAHPALRGLGTDRLAPGGAGHPDQRGAAVADADETGRRESWRAESAPAQFASAERGCTRWPSRPGEPQHEWEAPRLAYGDGRRRDGRGESERREQQGASGGVVDGCCTDGEQRDSTASIIGLVEPRLGVATNGLPRRLAGLARRSALKALGNAVVPKVAEVIGRAIMEAA